MNPSLDLLPPLHPPGRSRTGAAWSALIGFLILLIVLVLHSFLLQQSINLLLWASGPITGITIHAETLPVDLKKPLRWQNVVISFGKAPHESRLDFKMVSIELVSLRRLFSRKHRLIKTLEVSQGKCLVDLRNLGSEKSSFLENQKRYVQNLVQQQIIELPESIILNDVSLLCMREKERLSVEHCSCSLPKNTPGTLAYESILFEVSNIKCYLHKAACHAIWDGKTITLKNLLLAEEVHLHQLELTTYPDRLELGFVATIFHGILRADGCLRKNGPGPMLDGAIFGEKLSLERLAKFFGFQEKISGVLREGRLVFRGSPFEPINAEASLRMLVDHFRCKKKEWASLSIASNFIGRKISLTGFHLQQHENRVSAIGEMSISEDWSKIGEAPFHCKLEATIADASQLTDLFGTPWSNISGKIDMDGEVSGGANLAEGYLHLHGREISLHGLPIDVIESTLLFQKENILLSNLDFWNGKSHIQFSGSMANIWPHEYSGEGRINCRNFFETLMLLDKWVNSEITTDSWNEIPKSNFSLLAQICQNPKHSLSLLNAFISENLTIHSIPSLQPQGEKEIDSSVQGKSHAVSHFFKNIHGATLQAVWKGHGRAKWHEGSLKIGLEEALVNNQPLELHSTIAYTPQLVTSPIFHLNYGDRNIAASLSLSPHVLSLENFTFNEKGKRRLSASITLPMNGMGLFDHRPFPSLFEWNKPMEVYVALNHFSSFCIDGSIKSSGLWSRPSVAISLDSRKKTSNNNTSFHIQLSAHEGQGLIDAQLATENTSCTPLTRICHTNRDEEAAKADGARQVMKSDNGCMSTYCPRKTSSSTQNPSGLPTSTVDRHEIFGLSGTFPLGFIELNPGAALSENDQATIASLGGPLKINLRLTNSSLDFINNWLLPSEINLHHGNISGEIGLRGTVATPELLGHVTVKAAECTLGSLLPSLKSLQAIISLSKEKINLESGSAFLGKGKLEAFGSSQGILRDLYHEYHVLGHDLLLFKKENVSITGTAALVLQGNTQGGKLSGHLNITELNWKPQLTIIPYLIPPGIFCETASLASLGTSSWSNDVMLGYQPNDQTIHSTITSDACYSNNSFHNQHNNSFEKIHLHLLGPLLSPTPEGSIIFSNLLINTPRSPMRFLQGAMHFSLSQPWQPYFDLTAQTNIGINNINIHLREAYEGSHLFFESTPHLSQETAALLIAQPSNHSWSQQLASLWMKELPFWIRQQETEEPTTIIPPQVPPHQAMGIYDDLGFAGSTIVYHTQLE